MNEPRDTDETAALLDHFKPAVPSRDLVQRLLAACPAAPGVAKRPRILTFMPRVAAAAVAIAASGAVIGHFAPRSAPKDILAGPSAATATDVAPAPAGTHRHIRQELLGMRDLGIARDALSRPVRLLHTRWLDHETTSPDSQASPAPAARVRDEIVPVVLTTY